MEIIKRQFFNQQQIYAIDTQFQLDMQEYRMSILFLDLLFKIKMEQFSKNHTTSSCEHISMLVTFSHVGDNFVSPKLSQTCIVTNIDIILSVWSALVYIVIVHWLWYINIYTKQYTFHCIFYSDTINMFDKHACNSSLVFYYEIITVVKVNANAASDSRIFIEQRSSKYITVLTVPSESRDVSLTSWEPKRFRIGFEGHWAFSNSWIRRKSNSFFKETLLKLKTKNYLNLTKTFNHVVKKSLPRIFICDHFEIVSTTGLSRTFHFKVSKITRT